MRLGGRYRLQDRIAFGGMGEVWRALDEVLGRKVAVKILRPELAYDDNFRRRFRAEARTAGALSHPGIAAVYDYGEGPVVPADSDVRGGPNTPGQGALTDDDVAYLVMELVPGEPLSTMLSRGALGVDATLDIVAQSARALHAAHERGVVHRDVKPANLLVTPDGTLKVTDFGIARPRDHEPLTMTGQVMGTAHYLAPELARGREATPLSDVYALGVVMYECLAGRRPFEGDNQVAVATAHLAEPPPPLPGTLPQDVRELVDLAMEKDPDNRTQSAAEFAHECELVLRRRRRPQRPASEAAARTESIRREIDLRDAGQRAAGLAAGTAVAGSAAAAAAAAAGTEHLPAGTPDGYQQATPPDGPTGYDQGGAGYTGPDGYGYPGANGSNGYPSAGYAGNGYQGNGYNGAGYGGNGYDANGYGYPAQGEQTVSYGSDGYPRPAAGLATDGYGNGPATPATPSLGLSRTGGSHRGRDRRVLPFALTPAMIALLVLIAAVVIGLVVMAAILFGGGKDPSVVPVTTPSITPSNSLPVSQTPTADASTSTGPTKTPKKTTTSPRRTNTSGTATPSRSTTKPPTTSPMTTAAMSTSS
ncbi:serine/threonine-protein kinase, partial [Kineosporia sp. A_224]|uniref:serine/threonine-protein kinase n=1 Tax=Kineosporia sp. A_224 TaxID=1962180 RepID=UPI0018E9467E